MRLDKQMGGLIFSLRADAVADIHYWLVADGEVADQGVCDVEQLAVHHSALAADAKVMALAPAADCVLRWHDMGDLPKKQAEAAAKVKTSNMALQPEMLHIVAVQKESGVVLTAHAAKKWMQQALEILSEHAVSPDIILPAALAIPPPDDGVIAAQVASERILRGDRMASLDEPAFRDLFAPDEEVKELDQAKLPDSLLAAFANPQINLRSGIFAKSARGNKITSQQWGILGWLTFALLLLSGLLALTTYWKYASATDRENSRALTAAAKIVPGIADVEQAETEIANAISAGGGASDRFLSLSAALYSALRDAELVQLRKMQYGNDAILDLLLSAPSAEVINPVLIDLQQQGYVITATPRQEANGLTLVDVTMRMP